MATVSSISFSRLSISSGAPTAAASSAPCRPRASFSVSRFPLSSSQLQCDSLALGAFFCRPLTQPISRRPLVTVGAATKKPDSAAKRARQAEKNRIYNKARKSEMSTRMKKVFVALEDLKKQTEPSVDMMAPIESLIAEAFSIIDKSVKVGTIHRNKGAHRKSRLSRAKKAAEVQLGWYTPSASV